MVLWTYLSPCPTEAWGVVRGQTWGGPQRHMKIVRTMMVAVMTAFPLKRNFSAYKAHSPPWSMPPKQSCKDCAEVSIASKEQSSTEPRVGPGPSTVHEQLCMKNTQDVSQGCSCISVWEAVGGGGRVTSLFWAITTRAVLTLHFTAWG